MHENLSPLGQYRGTFAAQALPEAFPSLEGAIRLACGDRRDGEFCIQKGGHSWTITSFRGVTGGFRAEFTPRSNAFGPPEVEVSVFRWSRVAQSALYLAVAACLATLAATWSGALPGFRKAPLLEIPLNVVLVGVFFACLGGAASCALMYAGGGRLSDAELVAIGEAIAAELGRPKPLDVPVSASRLVESADPSPTPKSSG